MPAQIPRQRLEWIDTAKGACILLVVMYHTLYFIFTDGHMADTMAFQIWDKLMLALRPLRMPLFFLISGFLAHSAVYRPSWRDVFRPRILSLLWLYVLWMLIDWALRLFLLNHGNSNYVPGSDYMPMTLPALMKDAMVGDTTIWYLYALVIYFTICRLGRNHVGLTLVVTGLSSIFYKEFLTPEYWSLMSMASNVIFFTAGCYAKPFIARHATHFSAPRLVVATGAAGALMGLVQFFDLAQLPGVRMVIAALLIIAAIDVTAWATSYFKFAFLCKIGRNTLPIYVMHVALIGFIAQLVGPLNFDGVVGELFMAVAPLVLTVANVALCLSIYLLVNRKQGCALFAWPSRSFFHYTS